MVPSRSDLAPLLTAGTHRFCAFHAVPERQGLEGAASPAGGHRAQPLCLRRGTQRSATQGQRLGHLPGQPVPVRAPLAAGHRATAAGSASAPDVSQSPGHGRILRAAPGASPRAQRQQPGGRLALDAGRQRSSALPPTDSPAARGTVRPRGASQTLRGRESGSGGGCPEASGSWQRRSRCTPRPSARLDVAVALSSLPGTRRGGGHRAGERSRLLPPARGSALRAPGPARR